QHPWPVCLFHQNDQFVSFIDKVLLSFSTKLRFLSTKTQPNPASSHATTAMQTPAAAPISQGKAGLMAQTSIRTMRRMP
ncbi:hypothetical protein, partial [Pollutimonas bauzanensis]|uniref:hypothetical protein n=1 Tax=Pollutimonas bauzanensis TaxID=658167 RepID=UPI003342C065